LVTKRLWSFGAAFFLGALLIAVSYGVSEAPFRQGRLSPEIQHVAPLPSFIRDGEALKTFNLINPFGFGIAAADRYLEEPYVAGWRSVDEALPKALSQSLTAAGFNGSRLVVDPAPLLAAATDEEVNRLLDRIQDGIAAIVRAGFRCILDIHPSPKPMVAGYSDRDLIDGPDGKKFRRLI
jgi:hypothetical protein